MSETFRTCLRHHQKMKTWLELLDSGSAEDRKTNRLQASKSGSGEKSPCFCPVVDHPSCGQHFRHPRASVSAAGLGAAGLGKAGVTAPFPTRLRAGVKIGAAVWFA